MRLRYVLIMLFVLYGALAASAWVAGPFFAGVLVGLPIGFGVAILWMAVETAGHPDRMREFQ